MRARSITALWALSLSVPLVTGCATSPRDRLQGRWLGESIENAPPGQVAKATGWVKGTAIEFTGNKVVVTIPAETPRSGTFKIAKAEGDQLTLSFLREEGGRDEAEFRFAPDQTLRWSVGHGQEIVLVRAKN
jgi:hypothetical protein